MWSPTGSDIPCSACRNADNCNRTWLQVFSNLIHEFRSLSKAARLDCKFFSSDSWILTTFWSSQFGQTCKPSNGIRNSANVICQNAQEWTHSWKPFPRNGTPVPKEWNDTRSSGKTLGMGSVAADRDPLQWRIDAVCNPEHDLENPVRVFRIAFQNASFFFLKQFRKFFSSVFFGNFFFKFCFLAPDSVLVYSHK